MADLFQSEYDVGSLRRGVQDGETLWALLAEDGTVTVVPDPTAPEVEAAQAKAAKLDPEDEDFYSPENAALRRVAGFAAAAPAEEEAEEKAAKVKEE